MLKMHIRRTRITFKFMLWLAVPVGVFCVAEVGVDVAFDGDAEAGIDDDVVFGLMSDLTKVNVPNLARGLSVSSEPLVLFVIR